MRGSMAGCLAPALIMAGCAPAQEDSGEQLRVILIPADGGTEDGTRADYQPIFDAIAKTTGLSFDIRVGQSYAMVVEALCNNKADIAFVGPITYLQARERGCADLLAVGVENDQSIYHAGLFARSDSPIQTVAELKGHAVAFGDVNSTSSFLYPVAMVIDVGIDPVRDLSAVRMTGSHADSLAALAHGQVDAAALSFDSFEKAANEGAVDPATIRVIGKSAPIPYPPLVMNNRLDDGMKRTLRAAFASVHEPPGITPDMIRGYGGKQVDRYDSTITPAQFDSVGLVMAQVDEPMKAALIRKAAGQ